jgi:mRNA-degrading endonuclease RelE of RelBE toxin-antitoxin system
VFPLRMFSRSTGQKKVPKYRLIFHRKAEKALVALDEKMKHHLLEDIGRLENFTGFESDLAIVKIQGQKNFYRLRTQRIRTIFFVEQKSKTIVVLKIEKRENVYE